MLIHNVRISGDGDADQSFVLVLMLPFATVCEKKRTHVMQQIYIKCSPF